TGPMGRFNTWLAVHITKTVGSMWIAYLFACVALISLPAAIRSGDVIVIVSWVAQTFLQLVLLPIIIVGQNVIQAANDARAEADGDVRLYVRLDDPYVGLLNAGNLQEGGNLIVEPVCRFPPVQAEAIRVCASDPDPLAGPLPAVGEHVWLEGRYALDLQHHAW